MAGAGVAAAGNLGAEAGAEGAPGTATGAWAEEPDGDPKTASKLRADASVRAVMLLNRDWNAIISLND